MKLAILIPSIYERKEYYNYLYDVLQKQIGEQSSEPHEVIILSNIDNKEKPIGQKRNELLQTALTYNVRYIAFFDDDDLPSDNYIQKQLEVCNSGLDCGSLWGQIYWDGLPGKPFHHSLKYDVWSEDDKYYYRCPNHLNCIKLDLVKDIKFHETNFGEDGNWSMDIQKANVLKTEYEINEIIYHYFCGNPKHKI